MIERSSRRVLRTSADATLSRRRRTKEDKKVFLALLIVVSVLLWVLGALMWSRSFSGKIPVESFAYNIRPIDWEFPDFEKTMKDCIPKQNPKCLQHVPEGTTTQRIAVLSLPGSLARMFEKFIHNLVGDEPSDLVLIPTTHVPPYGYGKTHGYTKIIRFHVSPLLTYAADILNNAQDQVTLKDLRQVVRQIVRWHCRLSHVAAHTALYTVTLQNMMEAASDENKRLASFLGLAKRQVDDGGAEIDELEASVQDVMTDVSRLLTQIKDPSQRVEEVVHSVIRSELEATSNLTKWPCPSFWTVGDEADPEDLTPLARKLAKELSPDCDAEFTECSVPRDRCEARGDAKCKN